MRVCYGNDDLVSLNGITQHCCLAALNLGGETPLIMCRSCVNSGVEPPYSGARKNMKQTQQQKKASKKRRMEKVVKGGRRQAR